MAIRGYQLSNAGKHQYIEGRTLGSTLMQLYMLWLVWTVDLIYCLVTAKLVGCTSSPTSGMK